MCEEPLGCVQQYPTIVTECPDCILDEYDDGNPCTIDSCDILGGGMTEPYVCPSAPSDCSAYQCVNIEGAPVCQLLADNVGDPCNDLIDCTFNDTCTRLGTCEGIDLICPVPTQCEVSFDCDGGICTPIYRPEGYPCNTGNLCTNNTCNGAGMCVEGDPIVTCEALNQCHDPGVCNPLSGLCSNPSKVDGSSCNDGNNCTRVDECISAQCIGSDPVSCPASDQCHLAGQCNTTSGQCSDPPAPDYTNCNDNNTCTSSSLCINAICTPVAFVDCSSPNPCVTTWCDEVDGCQAEFNEDPCDSGNQCYVNTTCNNGTCPIESGDPLFCDDHNGYTIDLCMVYSGCAHTPVSDCQFCLDPIECPTMPCMAAVCYLNGTCGYIVDVDNLVGCDDSIFCNGQESCSIEGTCMPGALPDCADSNGCTTDECDYDTDECVHYVNVNQSCVSENLCSLAAQCNEDAECIPFSFIQCDPAPPCQILNGCEPPSGICNYTNMIDGTPCNDTNACTQLDQCLIGQCDGSDPVICVPLNQCYLQGTCVPLTGICTDPPSPDGTECDDGVFCSPSSHCSNATCVRLTPPMCPISVGPYDSQCQEVICNEEYQNCSIVNLPDNTTCVFSFSTGVCSGTDGCQFGICTRNYSVGTMCRAGNESDCDVAEYCVEGEDDCPSDTFAEDGTPCPDTLFCYTNECMNATCVPVIPLNCSYLDTMCQVGDCNELAMDCELLDRTNGTSCEVEEIGPCVLGGGCEGGSCFPIFAEVTTSCSNESNMCLLGHCSGTSEICILDGAVDCSNLTTECLIGTCNITDGSCYTLPSNSSSCSPTVPIRRFSDLEFLIVIISSTLFAGLVSYRVFVCIGDTIPNDKEYDFTSKEPLSTPYRPEAHIGSSRKNKSLVRRK